jgi:hypothetical protein
LNAPTNAPAQLAYAIAGAGYATTSVVVFVEIVTLALTLFAV